MKIYTDFSLLKFGKGIDMLFPFYTSEHYTATRGDDNEIIKGRFDSYCLYAKENMSITSLEDADIAVVPIYMPYSYPSDETPKELVAFIEKCVANGKKILVFSGHDVGNVAIKIKNAIVFSGAAYKSKNSNGLLSFPHFFEDFLERYKDGALEIRDKSVIPKIGFCGFAPPLNLPFRKDKFIALAKLWANYLGLMKYFPDYSSHSYRARVLIVLNRAKRIKTNFIIKGNFGFGPGGLNTGAHKEDSNIYRLNYINNIVDNDYTVCVRGIGNNSIRFYETLCCGRIPIFVNTDCILPFEDTIDWKKLCVWVEEKDIHKIGEIVNEYHHNLSESEFKNRQVQLRKIWEDYLSPVGFFNQFKMSLER
ncbi:hypothetical protein HYN56_22320 [Flavobacterium crocinum]|uniref:Exostosin GT47 domain-containing protein n=1 Tax=Flavobacterium crocinum TaxID=2183896 RepID=A0A2S1YRU2_9FLAO|nr:exostosin family protein [Flavobacterium crocinum]AWK06817.1 hypothetical protein HYN56_22320 [Flavobacterium crocinum]